MFIDVYISLVSPFSGMTLLGVATAIFHRLGISAKLDATSPASKTWRLFYSIAYAKMYRCLMRRVVFRFCGITTVRLDVALQSSSTKPSRTSCWCVCSNSTKDHSPFSLFKVAGATQSNPTTTRGLNQPSCQGRGVSGVVTRIKSLR